MTRFLALTGALVLGCGGSAGNATVEETMFSSALNVDLGASTALPNGLYVRDLVVGSGAEVQSGQNITIGYMAALSNGELFDSNTYTFTYGKNPSHVIEGLNQGFDGVKRGGTRQLLIPPALAYKANGAPPGVPPNAVVVFVATVQTETTGSPPKCSVAGGGVEGLGLACFAAIWARRRRCTKRSTHDA